MVSEKDYKAEILKVVCKLEEYLNYYIKFQRIEKIEDINDQRNVF